MNFLSMNPRNETTSGSPQTDEDAIKLILPTYDAKIEMSNCTYSEYKLLYYNNNNTSYNRTTEVKKASDFFLVEGNAEELLSLFSILNSTWPMPQMTVTCYCNGYSLSLNNHPIYSRPE